MSKDNGTDEEEKTIQRVVQQSVTPEELFRGLLFNRPPNFCPFCAWELKPGRLLSSNPQTFDPSAFRLAGACAVHGRRILAENIIEKAEVLVAAIEKGDPQATHVKDVRKALLALQNGDWQSVLTSTDNPFA